MSPEIANRLTYTVTITTETTGDHMRDRKDLSHSANQRTESVTHTFRGEQAHERAQACYQKEVERLQRRGRWPGYVTTVDLAAVAPALASVEV